jgi:hypothetical protein
MAELVPDKTTVSASGTTTQPRYVARILAAELSATARFCDAVVQVDPLLHDDGALLSAIDAPQKSVAALTELAEPAQDPGSRVGFLLNGQFNACHDLQGLLQRVTSAMSRGDRLLSVLYAPWAQWVFRLANAVGLRRGPVPDTFVTETELRALLKLSDLELVRVRPCVFLPVWIPLLSALLNAVLPAIPIVRRLALAWVIVARPVPKPEASTPSLSIIIPARNERGNLADALNRLPPFSTQQIEVIFVEGHSSDGTWEEIQRLCADSQSRFTLRCCQQTGRGKNDAVRLGFALATGDLVTILDADLTMPPELLPRFYEAWRAGHGDFINGNRLVYPMENAAMRRLNLLGNRFFAKALSLVLGISIGDSLCGTKLLARRDYQRLVAWRERFGDFDPFGDFELLFAASELALGVVDLPIRYRERTYGSTNISRFRDGWQLLKMTMTGLFRLRLGRIR